MAGGLILKEWHCLSACVNCDVHAVWGKACKREASVSVVRADCRTVNQSCTVQMHIRPCQQKPHQERYFVSCQQSSHSFAGRVHTINTGLDTANRSHLPFLILREDLEYCEVPGIFLAFAILCPDRATKLGQAALSLELCPLCSRATDIHGARDMVQPRTRSCD